MKKYHELSPDVRSAIDIGAALRTGDSIAIERFIEQGVVDPRKVTSGDKWSLLHQALVMPNRLTPGSFIRYLISLGIDVNAQDVRGWTPLHFAARQSNAAAESALLEAGADVNAKNDRGAMPLNICLSSSPLQLDAVEVLLRHGADIATARKYVEVVVGPYTAAVAELVKKYDKR